MPPSHDDVRWRQDDARPVKGSDDPFTNGARDGFGDGYDNFCSILFEFRQPYSARPTWCTLAKTSSLERPCAVTLKKAISFLVKLRL